ncbi:Mrp/NBP35 family ATP-binding protein, partial [Candidatus Fermentibacterales bacterium]|nr:Mrp/NBP35 family ATP-binding protein [Candidatus Fermentibacterales bacterium]
DIDFHGPSIPKLLGMEGQMLTSDGTSVAPAMFGPLRVVSIDFMLGERTDAVIWRGPMKANVARQLLEDVDWGPLKYLVVDSPPGTGDEPLSMAQLIPGEAGALIVTTAQQVSTNDVARSITFCRKLDLPVLGVIENMSGMTCPHCGGFIELFGTGGGERLAAKAGVEFLGRIPFDPGVMESGEHGRPFARYDPDSNSGRAFSDIVGKLLGIIASRRSS